VLHVLSPDPAMVTDSRWLRRALDRGAYVYPLDLQWRTAAVLTEVGRIEAPGNLRNLVESVHGPQARAVPAVLEKAERDRVGGGQSEHSLAAQNVIDWENGYRAGAARADDRNYPTRLGEPQHVLALARWNEGRLMPWAGDPLLALSDRWQLSEVQAAERKFAGLPLPDPSAPEILAANEAWPEWKRESVRLCPVADDGTICQGLRYDADTGLRFISGDDKQ
jgi:CRISPR-associated endonuclease/helicase Cas3